MSTGRTAFDLLRLKVGGEAASTILGACVIAAQNNAIALDRDDEIEASVPSVVVDHALLLLTAIEQAIR